MDLLVLVDRQEGVQVLLELADALLEGRVVVRVVVDGDRLVVTLSESRPPGREERDERPGPDRLDPEEVTSKEVRSHTLP